MTCRHWLVRINSGKTKYTKVIEIVIRIPRTESITRQESGTMNVLMGTILSLSGEEALLLTQAHWLACGK